MPFLNVYETNKSYGGSEEGGWYYSTGEVVSTQYFHNEAAAKAALARKKDKVAIMNDGRKPPSSVACTGWFVACLEDDRAKAYPETRPHYE